MTDPAAFIPSAVAKRDLVEIVRQSKLTINGVSKRTAGGSRTADKKADVAVDDFRASYNPTVGVATIAPIWVDFYDWHFSPFLAIAGGPTSLQDKRLRLTISAKYELDERWGTSPVNCETNEPTFDWVDSSGGTPTSEAGVTDGSFFNYYFYIIRVQGGEITEAIDSPILKGWPFDSKA